MDKSLLNLRRQLRDCLVSWLESDAKLVREMLDESSMVERDIGDSHNPHPSLMNRDQRSGACGVVLRQLATDDKIGLLSNLIDERRPLKLIVTSYIGEPGEESWVVSRPGLNEPSLPQDIRDLETLFCIMEEAVIPNWIDYLSEDAPPVAQAPTLGKQARAVLELLYRDKAFDEDHACNLKKRAPTQLRYESAKSPETKDKYAKAGAAELKRLKLADAVPNVGTWLTTEGRARAESLFGQKPR